MTVNPRDPEAVAALARLALAADRSTDPETRVALGTEATQRIASILPVSERHRIAGFIAEQVRGQQARRNEAQRHEARRLRSQGRPGN